MKPIDRELLETTASVAFEVEGQAAALELFQRWLDSFDAQPDPASALTAYRQAVEKYPKQLGWRSRLAILLMQAESPEEAAEHFERLLADYGKRKGAAAERHMILEQLVALRPDRMDLRLEMAKSLAALGRTGEAAHLMETLADRHLHNGDLEEGVSMLRGSLELEPNQKSRLIRTAELLDRVGREEEAIELYERLAELNRQLSDRSHNIPVLEKLLAHDPERVELRAELGEAYEVEGDVDRAIEHYYRLAQAYAGRKDQVDRSVGLCLKIRGLAPEFPAARELLVENWLTLDERDKAKQELDKLGDDALESGRLEQAETYFKRVQGIDPDDIGCGERLGKIYEARGMIDEASEAFERVLDIYERMSETARALSVLQKLKGLRPDDMDVRGRLARMLLELGGDRTEAGKEWLEIVELALIAGDEAAARAAAEEVMPVFAQDWRGGGGWPG